MVSAERFVARTARLLHVRSGFALSVFFSPYVEMHHDPAPPTLHRRPASAQLRTPNHRHLREPNRLLCQALRPLARTARPGRNPSLPTPPSRTPPRVGQL